MPLALADYPQFLAELKVAIRQRQVRALRALNHELLALYWDIGQAIQRKQEALGWGRAVVETLARDLQAEFPGRNGFSARNLWNMRDFFLEYSRHPNLQPLVAEISWAKNLVVHAIAARLQQWAGPMSNDEEEAVFSRPAAERTAS